MFEGREERNLGGCGFLRSLPGGFVVETVSNNVIRELVFDIVASPSIEIRITCVGVRMSTRKLRGQLGPPSAQDYRRSSLSSIAICRLTCRVLLLPNRWEARRSARRFEMEWFWPQVSFGGRSRGGHRHGPFRRHDKARPTRRHR